jgi:Ca2+-transporting ATPase
LQMNAIIETVRRTSGLSHDEAQKRLEKYGLNVLRAKRKKPGALLLAEQFTDFMVVVLLASTAISAFMGEMVEAVTIAAIVVINSILGFIQEYRSERALEALKRLAAPKAKVVRGGEIFSIPAEEVVPGDVIVLEAGDRVSADAVLVEAASVSVDESLLTGESFPVEKKVDNSVFMGTVVTRGRGRAVAYATGMNTEMGSIADMIQNVDDEKTPLQKRLDALGKYIVTGCLFICAAVSFIGILRGEDTYNMLLAGISLAVAAVPEGLPAVVTVSLAVGVQKMVKRRAVIRRLPAVETLGCTDVICTDKTGTLTENKMVVRKIYAGGMLFDVDKDLDKDRAGYPVRLLLKGAALCNNARVEEAPKGVPALSRRLRINTALQKNIEITGDPTETALLDIAIKLGAWDEIKNEEYSRVDEIPFDSDRKLMTVTCIDKKGDYYVFSKGAPDVLINKCSHVITPSGPASLTPALKAKIMLVNDRIAGEAFRVLGVAYKKTGKNRTNLGNMEDRLVFIGLAGLFDPPRKEARAAVQKCITAGIRPVMITGDHKITACAIARELGIYRPGEQVLTGADIERIGEKGLLKMAEKTSVYCILLSIFFPFDIL